MGNYGEYNINADIIRVGKAFGIPRPIPWIWFTELAEEFRMYEKGPDCSSFSHAVLFNGSTGDWFRTTAGFRQPTLFYHLPQKENHGVSAKEAALLPVSAKEAALLPTSVLQNSEEEQEADFLQDRLDTNKGYKMKLGPDKTKVMTNNQNDFQREISK